MASYNGAKYIKEQVMSIIPQLGKDDEIVISDDGSTDGTLEIISSIDDKRIHVLNHKPLSYKHSSLVGFRRVADNFENALKNASGDVIFLSDQDDIWAPDKVEKMTEALKTSDIVQCNCSIIDGGGSVTAERFRQQCPYGNGVVSNLMKMSFIGCCLAFNRKVLDWTMPFPDELMAHDFWIGVIGEKVGKMTYIDEPLHFYRQHGTNVSPGSSKSSNSIFTKISYRVELLFQIIQRLNKISGK